jgi:hypothetical protein
LSVCPKSVLILLPALLSHIIIYPFISPLTILLPSYDHFIESIKLLLFHYFILFNFFKSYIQILPLTLTPTINYLSSLIFTISTYLSGITPNVQLFICALLNLVPLQYILINSTFYKLKLFKLVFSRILHDKPVLCILILFKFIAIMAAAELFYIDLSFFD